MSASPEFLMPPRRKPGPAPKVKVPSPSSNGMALSYFLHAPDTVLRDRYAHTLDKNEALKELARLRKICEIAAMEINQRLVPDESKCYICSRELPAGFKVCMMVNVRDDQTGTISTHPLCGIDCVKQWNRKKMGLAELVK